jgi:DNA ligase-1
LNEEALLELYRKFEHLRNCNKKKDKIDCLKEYQHDTLFTFVLEFLLNTHKKTGISDAKLKKSLIDKPYEPFTCLEALINYVVSNPTGKDNIVHSVQQYIDSLPNFTLKRFITELITKKYKCGVTAKFVGEVLPNLIKVEHQVMLANKFRGDLKEEAYITLKLDGIRCSALIGEQITFLTRQGKEIEGLNQIAQALSEMNLKGYMIDGELLRINHDGLPSDENFKETTSIVNSKSDNKTGLEFVIFDMVSLDDYRKQENNETYEVRQARLNEMITPNDYIRLVPSYGKTNDVNKVYEILNEVTSQDEEGLMLNLVSGVYRFGKRSSELLKVKAMHTCDLKCIDVQEGEGKYANTLGRILCLYKGHILKVGSGFSDEQREYYWKHKDKIKMHIVEVQYFEESNNEQGGLSLRFPVFKRIRDDKNEESYE